MKHLLALCGRHGLELEKRAMLAAIVEEVMDPGHMIGSGLIL